MIRKRRKIRLKYKKERVLLSDVLPYELPVIFSNRYFYRFLVSNGVKLENHTLSWKAEIGKDAQAILDFMFAPYCSTSILGQANNSIALREKTPVSIPFLFKVKHKPHKYRRLALIHPANQLEIVSFYEKYKSLILYNSSMDKFSLRHPERVACFFYYKDRLHHTLLGKKMDKLELFFNEYENLKTYFSYKEYSNIYKFYEDYRYQNAEKRFEHLHKFDVQSCFDSIYSHSIAWAICGGKDEFKKQFKANGESFAEEWDRIMQRMNYNETNGILVGPEFSRIFAEVILQYVDRRVMAILKEEGYVVNEHYACYRYVDDFFFYYNDPNVLDLAMSSFESLLHEYKLSISKEKSVDYERPFITPISMAKIKIDSLLTSTLKLYSVNDQDDLGKDNEELEERDKVAFDVEKVKQALECKDYIYVNSREFNRSFKSLMIENNVTGKDIMNYTLAVTASKLERLLKKIDRNIFVLRRAIDEHYEENECRKKLVSVEKMMLRYLVGILDVIFFLYSDCKRVNTTLKMMNILNDIIIYVSGKYECKDGHSVSRFSSSLKDEVFRKIQNEISIVFKTTKFDLNAQIETLFFLITIKSMPRQYRLDAAMLEQYLQDARGKRIDPSNLNALSIVILLYYYGNAAIYDSYKKWLLEGINNKYNNVNLPDLRKDAELMVLTLDLLACPYISHNDRKQMCNKMQISEQQQRLMEKYFRRHKFMFTKWTNVDLTKELGAKVSQEVYT